MCLVGTPAASGARSPRRERRAAMHDLGMLARVAFIALGLARCLRPASACTTIVVGRNATIEGSTISTHNADCLDCDFRLGRVPARDWPPGSVRPIVKYRAEYPRTVSEDRGATWTPENLDPELPQRDTWKDKSWREAMVLGYIPQVAHTFAYLEGLYGIINEKQVAIGESTCGAKWFSGPVSEDCAECNSLLDVSELSRIALERASTAREAIQLMGDLAVEHGFYGSAWDGDDSATYLEAGEALTVTDSAEAWVFHVLSDDTSTSAVWAAQRVLDDHIAVVANQFSIEEVHPDASPDDIMFSDNIFDVAERSVDGYDRASGPPLHFTRAFSKNPDDLPRYGYSTRRIWRVQDVVAPSLKLSPYMDAEAGDYPFSVRCTTSTEKAGVPSVVRQSPALKCVFRTVRPMSDSPDKPVTVQDIMALMRDHYEGTQFDLTKGLASGPYGDVDRFDPAPSMDGSTSNGDSYAGSFERSISLFRTSYTTVTQSRSHLPDEVGGLVWLAQYKPSMSTFIPLYVNIDKVPRPYTIGSLQRFDRAATFWAFSVVGNWVGRFRMFAHDDVAAEQARLEQPLFDAQAELESKATALVRAEQQDEARALLTKQANDSAYAALASYQDLFDTLVAKFHDGYKMKDPHSDTVEMVKMFYPRAWLQAVGFFSSEKADTVSAAAKAPSPDESGCDQDAEALPRQSTSSESALNTKAQGEDASTGDHPASHGGVGQIMLISVFTLVGVLIGRWSTTRSEYTTLPEQVAQC